jgi:hypothetical protein
MNQKNHSTICNSHKKLCLIFPRRILLKQDATTIRDFPQKDFRFRQPPPLLPPQLPPREDCRRFS